MVLEGYYTFEKRESFAPENKYRAVWVEEITDGHREIYVRCVGCHVIFQIADRMGTRSIPISISPSGTILPCLTCPQWNCGAHMFATLKGYEHGKARDVFSR